MEKAGGNGERGLQGDGCNVGDAETRGNNHFCDFCIPLYGSIDNPKVPNFGV